MSIKSDHSITVYQDADKLSTLRAPSDLADEHVNVAPTRQKELTMRTGLAILGGFFATFVTTGFANSFGVFQVYYKLHQLKHKSDFDIIWIASFQSFMMFALAPVAGALFDKKGPLIPLSFGSVCLLVGIFMLSLCKEYYQFFLAQGLLMGVGMSFLTIPALASITRSFDRNRGFASGIFFAGSSVGGVIWPIELDQLLNFDGLSFGWTIRIIGFTMLPLCIITVLTVRPTPTINGRGPQVASSSDEKARQSKGLSIIKNPAYDFLVIGMSLLFFGFFTPLFLASTYATTIGLSTSFSFYIPSIALAASFFGRLLPGILADRSGAFNILLVSAVASTVIAFCWSTVTNTGGIVVWVLAYGFTSGSFLSLQAACAAKLATPETHGVAIGLLMGLCAVAGLVGPPISGALVPQGYLNLSMYTGAMMAGGSVFLALARFYQKRGLFEVV